MPFSSSLDSRGNDNIDTLVSSSASSPSSPRRISSTIVYDSSDNRTPKPPSSRRTSGSSSGPSRTQSASHARHHSIQSIRLDLDGLDLGGNPTSSTVHLHESRIDSSVMQRHTRSQSGTGTLPVLQDLHKRASSGFHRSRGPSSSSATADEHSEAPFNAEEDSFSAHLRVECSDYREIMSSHAALQAASVEKAHDASLSHLDDESAHGTLRPHNYRQVLGAFASLGLQTEEMSPFSPISPIKKKRLPARRTFTKESTESSDAPPTPRDGKDTFPVPYPADYSASPKWAHLTGRPCNPLEPLDILSVQEMGFHGLDVGSLNDWEGCKLSAEILCPVTGHKKIEWSVAQTTRRTKKWVVVPNAPVICGVPDQLTGDVQAQRTVIVSERSLWLDHTQKQQPNPRPFSGRAGFEIRTLRAEHGKIHPPLYLANAATHRVLHSFRTNTDIPLSLACGSIVDPPSLSETSKQLASQPVYPILRRSRSRPYLRTEHVPLRRSRSKPYLRYSAKHHESGIGKGPEDFAPSLPGDPVARFQPGESWPSARSPHSDSLSSFGSATTSDGDSDQSSGGNSGIHFSTTNSRDSASFGSPPQVSSSYSGPSSFDQVLLSARLTAQENRFRPIRPAVDVNGLAPPSDTAWSLSPASTGSRAMSPMMSPYFETALGRAWQRDHSDADLWREMSPTTASSVSSSSKSGKKKGLQRALQKKDKVLGGWFKKKPMVAATLPPFAGTPSINQLVFSPPILALKEEEGIPAPGASSRNKQERRPGSSTALTEHALEQFERGMHRPASPESTVMGSRRGSEALTQKTTEPLHSHDRSEQTRSHASFDGGLAEAVESKLDRGRRANMEESRTAVNSTLARIYGWDEETMTGKTLPELITPDGRSPRLQGSDSLFQDLDEENALLGIEMVPAEALTMLIPLPFLGRRRSKEAVRYMRVNFVPFREAEGRESISSTGGTPALERDEASSPITPLSAKETSSPVGKMGDSNWKRKLGLSGASLKPGSGIAASQSGPQLVSKSRENNAPTSPSVGSPEAFRVTAVVLNAPWTSAGAKLDPRLPEAGTFPVVLGYCNGSKALEMIPEGWAALRLGPSPELNSQDISTWLDTRDPLNAVTDIIIAACAAVMDI